MATTWDLARMRSVIRKLIGKLDVTQITDSEIDNYINDFYLYDFPEDLRTLKLKVYYEFTTVPNQAVYALPQNYYQVNPPVYVDGYQSAWYQDPDLFYRIWPELRTIQKGIYTGDGVLTTFPPFTLNGTPILQGSVLIGNVQESFVDDSNGNLISSITNLPSGNINYLTGVISNLTFQNIVPAGLQVNAHYYPYVASRPRDILFYQQNFYLRPVPNDIYRIKTECYIQPTTALGFSQFQSGNTNDLPLFTEWWQLLTYGAALKVFIEDSDHEQYQRHLVYYEDAKLKVQRRALKQLSNQRILSNYSDNVGSPAWPVFPFY